MQSEETDGDVENLAGNLVAVDEAAPLAVDGDQAEGAGGAGDVAPVGGGGRDSGGGGEVAIFLRGRGR